MLRFFLCLTGVVLIATETVAVEVIYEGSPPPSAGVIQRLVERGVLPDSVAALLRAEGYLDAQATRRAESVSVRTGPLYRIDTVLVSGAGTDDVILDNGSFTRQRVKTLFGKVLEPYYDRGYYWASAAIDRMAKRDGRVSLSVVVKEGPLVSVSGVRLTGLSRTRSDIVAALIPLRAGDTLTEHLLDRADRAASGIEFVRFQPPVRIRPAEGYTSADVELSFSELRQFTFQGGGSYSPGAGGSLLWHVDLRFNNLFGGGRQVGVLSQRRAEGRHFLRLRYRQPFLAIGRGRVDIEVATRDYREQFYEFSADVGYSVQLSAEVAAGVGLGWKTVEPKADLAAYSRFAATFLLERSTLDDRHNPSGGTQMIWSLAYAYRRYGDDTVVVPDDKISRNETRAVAGLHWYQRLVAGIVGHLALNYEGLETGESLPPLSELSFVGGPGTIRGFQNEQFAVLRTCYGTLEPRWRFTNGYLSVFSDAAYLNNRIAGAGGHIVTDELFRYGYGISVALSDRLRSMTLSLGWNPHTPFDQPRLSVEFSSDI